LKLQGWVREGRQLWERNLWALFWQNPQLYNRSALANTSCSAKKLLGEKHDQWASILVSHTVWRALSSALSPMKARNILTANGQGWFYFDFDKQECSWLSWVTLQTSLL
jgi:hypothetical protein